MTHKFNAANDRPIAWKAGGWKPVYRVRPGDYAAHFDYRGEDGVLLQDKLSEWSETSMAFFDKDLLLGPSASEIIKASDGVQTGSLDVVKATVLALLALWATRQGKVALVAFGLSMGKDAAKSEMQAFISTIPALRREMKVQIAQEGMIREFTHTIQGQSQEYQGRANAAGERMEGGPGYGRPGNSPA